MTASVHLPAVSVRIGKDIIQLVNGDAASWLVGMTDVPKTFGLELLDTVLTDFAPVFFKINEFRFLLKEHVCALIIRLFSPNVKYRAALTAAHIPGAPPAPPRPLYPVSMRLLRLVSVLVHKYHAALVSVYRVSHRAVCIQGVPQSTAPRVRAGAQVPRRAGQCIQGVPQSSVYTGCPTEHSASCPCWCTSTTPRWSVYTGCPTEQCVYRVSHRAQRLVSVLVHKYHAALVSVYRVSHRAVCIQGVPQSTAPRVRAGAQVPRRAGQCIQGVPQSSVYTGCPTEHSASCPCWCTSTTPRWSVYTGCPTEQCVYRVSHRAQRLVSVLVHKYHAALVSVYRVSHRAVCIQGVPQSTAPRVRAGAQVPRRAGQCIQGVPQSSVYTGCPTEHSASCPCWCTSTTPRWSVYTGCPTEQCVYRVSHRAQRLVSVLVHKYHAALVTECEIFLSLTIKFLDPDKPLWQRALALEVLHKMTIQPQLLKSFCECYDMKPHSTNIFQDIVNALGAYVQSLFVASQVNTPAGAQGIPQQPGFYWKGVWLPLCVTFEPGTAKSVYLEMLDRTEAPSIQDGYGISVAYACLMEVIRSTAITVEGDQYFSLEMLDRTEAPSIQEGYGISVAYACLMEVIRSTAITVEGDEYFRLQELYDDGQNEEEKEINSNNKIENSNTDNGVKTETETVTSNGHNGEEDQNSNITEKTEEVEDKEKEICLQLLKSSWCGLVWGMSVLAEASIGELEAILRAIQTLARVSGKVGHASGRDACISAICRCALPAQYGVAALSALPCPWRRDPAPPPDHDYRHQLVWVGTPLPTPDLPSGQQQSFVMVTSRHVTAMKALLCAAQRDGDALQQAWLPLLTTLQHLVWILGLKPSTGGSMKASRSSPDANAVMSTNAVMADLPGQQVSVAESLGVMSALSAMLSRVFESSKNLDDVALHHLIDALCKLSNEAMELAYSNREPSLFAVAKLLETGLANLHRIEVMWRPITNHLLEVCQHPHIRMREWGVEAITYLVQAAFQHHHANPALVTEARQRLLLEPLSELSSVRHCDVRARQLECCARLLHSRGEQLGAAWPLLIHIVGATSPSHSPALRRASETAGVLRASPSLARGAAGRRLAAAHTHRGRHQPQPQSGTATCERDSWSAARVSYTRAGSSWAPPGRCSYTSWAPPAPATVRHCDVRARQLECCARLLHSRGEQLGAAWPLLILLIHIVGATSPSHSEQLIRSAFQCVQLIAGDLLGWAGPRCLNQVLSAAAAFASQTKELNISLSAVGLMWNISDYLYHNRNKLATLLEAPPAPAAPPALKHLDHTWICLYVRLSELCTEPRAPVRRAATQTLFSCIGAHGSLLSPNAWTALLHVLYPMLSQVQRLSNEASAEKVDTGEHILIHHTRNTAQKQWAETQVLTLSGVCRVFHSRFPLLASLQNFPRLWRSLLRLVADAARTRSHEVSLAALKSFQEIVSAAGRWETEDTELRAQVWALAWEAYTDIAAPAAQEQGRVAWVYGCLVLY
ncbi:unnamed protein product [Plutella xylostella]|uniref:Protein MON2 homolog n=1 Tax=Plutella xylostella TaxID=51655 RepID=A0A8S4E2P0_PLUXY|nr:unnamed protein product [Plutella xylostella]